MKAASQASEDITENIKTVLCRCDFNWFEFIAYFQTHKQEDISSISFQSVSQCGLGVGLLRLSYLAYCVAESAVY